MLLKNKYFLIIGFFVILCGIPTAHAQAKAASNSKPEVNARSRGEKGRVFVYDAQDRRDPFVALVSHDGRILEPLKPKQSSGGLEIEGIIYDPKGASYVVINSEIYKAGDTYGEYRILKIQPRKIVFLKSGQEFEVEFKKEE